MWNIWKAGEEHTVLVWTLQTKGTLRTPRSRREGNNKMDLQIVDRAEHRLDWSGSG
jgi:hypothetical protein